MTRSNPEPGAPSADFTSIKHAGLPSGCWKPRPTQGGLNSGMCLVDYLDNDYQKASAEEGVFSGLVYLHKWFQEHMTIAAALSLPQLPHLNQVINTVSANSAKYRKIDDTWTTNSLKFDNTLTSVHITAIATTAIVREIENSAKRPNRLPGLGTTPAWPPHVLRGSREKRKCNKYAIALSLLEWYRKEAGDTRAASAVNKHAMQQQLPQYIRQIKNANPGYDQQQVEHQSQLPGGSPTTHHPALPTRSAMPEIPAARQPSSMRLSNNSTYLKASPLRASPPSAIDRESSAELEEPPTKKRKRASKKVGTANPNLIDLLTEQDQSAAPTGARPAEMGESAHVDIDLTMDDEYDDEVVMVKTEKVEANCNEAKGAATDDIDDLQYRLEVLNRQKRRLEIEEEQADIERKLAKHRHGAKQEVKEESRL